MIHLLDCLKGLTLSVIDQINISFSPFDPFTRDTDEADTKGLRVKADYYWKDIQANWLFGPKREFYWHASRNDLGDMCIWQGVYTAMCAFKYVKEPEPLVLKATLQALFGMNKLQTLSGANKLVRGSDSINGPYAKDPSRKYYFNGEYVYIDNVSESTLIGHLFGLWAFHYTGLKNPLVTQMISDLADQLIADGYILKNTDGSTPKFGNLKPGFLTAPIRIAALCSLFSLAYAITQKPIYREEYNKIHKAYRGALTHPETHFLWIHPFYQDVLAYMCLTMLLTTEKGLVDKDDGLIKDLTKSFDVLWEKTNRDGNPFYYAMYRLSTEKEFLEQGKQSLKTLREFDTEFNRGKQKVEKINSFNPSIPKVTWGYFSKKQTIARQPLPIWRRPGADFFWQRDPRSLDGDIGIKEVVETYNGMDFLVAYYLLRLIILPQY